MIRRPPAPVPDSKRKVGVPSLLKAVRLFREAGPDGMTREELAKALDKSPRQADRTVDVLVADGATFDKTRHARNGASIVRLVMSRGPKWDETITPDALAALKIASMALEQAGPEVWSNHFQTIEKLAGAQMSSKDRALFETLVSRIRFNGTVYDPPTLNPDVQVEVFKALGNPSGPLQLELTYCPPGRPSWTRAVFPYCLTHDVFAGGAFLLVWDIAKNRAVHLRLNRMEQAKALRTLAVIPDESPLRHAARYQIGGWSEPDPAFEIEVRVSGRTWPQALLESPPGLPDVAVRREEETGRVVVRFLATELNAPTRWILQFGSDAEVLKPDALKTLIRERMLAAAAQYPVTSHHHEGR